MVCRLPFENIASQEFLGHEEVILQFSLSYKVLLILGFSKTHTLTFFLH